MQLALASKTSMKASAHLYRKLQRCPIPRCFSLATKVMHIINPKRAIHCTVLYTYIWTSDRQWVDCIYLEGRSLHIETEFWYILYSGKIW